MPPRFLIRMPAERLSTALFRETRGAGFFRVLAGRNAPFYVDVLDALEAETADRADGIGRDEALALIVETLERHPDLEFEDEVGEMPADLRDKARALLEYLLKCHWLEEPPRRDWRRKIHFDAHGATLLAALQNSGQKRGLASLCIGGGEATAVALELID